MEKVRWGILSTAAIGLNKVIPAMQKAQHCEIAAIASRDPARAKSAAQKLGIPKAYGSYEELLAEPGIEAIYKTGLPKQRERRPRSLTAPRFWFLTRIPVLF